MPEASLRLDDLQTLPFDDGTFDVVTGFTSCFFADDMVAALREALRVAPVPRAAPRRSRARTTRPRCAPTSSARWRQADGSYRVANEWHVVVARA